MQSISPPSPTSLFKILSSSFLFTHLKNSVPPFPCALRALNGKEERKREPFAETFHNVESNLAKIKLRVDGRERGRELGEKVGTLKSSLMSCHYIVPSSLLSPPRQQLLLPLKAFPSHNNPSLALSPTEVMSRQRNEHSQL